MSKKFPVYTELRTRGALPPAWMVTPGQPLSRHKAPLPEHVVDIRNVCDYVHAVPQEWWSIVDDVPNVAPPFKNMWLEGRVPALNISEESGIHHLAEHERYGWGVMMFGAPLRRTVTGEELEQLVMQFASLGGAMNINTLSLNDSSQLRSSEADFLLMLSLFIEAQPGRVIGPVAYRVVVADKMGKPTWSSADIVQATAPDHPALNGSIQFGAIFCEAMLAVSFMHCRNVEMVEVTSEPTPKQRKRGVPRFTYRTLKIDPITRILDRQGEAATKGLAHALHVCRGHFKTYTDDAPLFGKNVGTWFWGDHVRGSADAGTVVKDYVVGDAA